jgi:hypothetical protein
MERYCSTGQNPQRAVASTEEEEYILLISKKIFTVKNHKITPVSHLNNYE